jgi:hypothetical protein
LHEKIKWLEETAVSQVAALAKLSKNSALKTAGIMEQMGQIGYQKAELRQTVDDFYARNKQEMLNLVENLRADI